MVAVAQASPAPPRRLVVVTTTPVTRRSPAALPAATYRRRRLVAAAVLAGMLLAVFVAVNALVAPRPAPLADQGETPGVVHVVQPGETFWAIAHALRPNDDPRPLVAQLVAAHGSASLTVGERIRLPAGS